MSAITATRRRTLTLALLLAALPQVRAQDAPRTYQEHVRPLLVNRCLGCHNPDQTRGGLDLSSHAALLAGGSGGSVVQPGDADGSRLFQLVSHAAEPKMPPGGPRIPDAELQVLRDWIQQGCRDNRDSAALKTVSNPALQMQPIEGFVPADGEIFPIGLPLDRIRGSRAPGAVHTLVAHPWSPLAVLAGEQQLLVYDLPTRELLGVLPLDGSRAEVLRITRSGKLLLVGGGVAGKSGNAQLFSLETGARLATLGEEYDSVLAADIDAAQRWVALGGPSRTIRIVSVADGTVITEIRKHTDWITALAYSPDGILLASADRNGGAHVWEAETAAAFHTLAGHPSAVTALAWRPDSDVLATGCADGRVRLWNMHDGRQLQAFTAHAGGVLSLAIARDGRILTGGREPAARLWAPDGKPLQQLATSAELVTAVAFDATDQQALTSGFRGLVEVWQLDTATRTAVLPHHLPPPAEAEAALAAGVATAEQQLASLNEAVAQATAEREALAEALARATEQLHLAQTAVASAARDADDLQQQLAGIRDELAALQPQREQLTAQQQSAAQQLAEAGQALAAASAEDARAGEAVEQATNDLAAAGRRVGELVSGSVDVDDPSLREAHCVYEECSRNLLQRYEDLARTLQQVAAHDLALQAARQQAIADETALAALTARTAALEENARSIAATQSTRSAGAAQAGELLAAASEALTQRQQESDQAQAALAALQSQLALLNSTRTHTLGRQAKWQAAALRPTLESLGTALHEKQAALLPFDRAVADADAALAENDRARAALLAEREALPARRATLAEQIAATSASLDAADAAIQSAQADLAARQARHQQTATALQHLHDAAGAEPDNVHLLAAREQATAVLAALTADCDAARAQLAQREAERATLIAQREQQQTADASAAESLQQIPECITALETARATHVAAREEARRQRALLEEPALLAEADLAECQERYDALLARWLEQTGR